MDNRRPNHSGEPAMENSDWRSRLPPESREKIINKVIESLKKHYPCSTTDGMQHLHSIAVRFEEKIYGISCSQEDYIRKISLKMLAMDSKSNSMNTNINSPDPAIQGMQSNNSAQLQPATNNQSQTLLGQNTVNNGGVVSSGLQGPSSSLLQNGNTTNVNVQSPNMQSISGVSQNPNVYANSQRQQQARQQQQPQTSQQQYLYQQQQFQQQLMKQKFSNISPFQQQQIMMSKPNNLANMQQHMVQQNSSNVMQQSQSQQSQSQQMVSNIQSQQMSLQQQQPNNRIQAQNLTDQQNGGDWQEDIFQKIRIMKEKYIVELTEMYKTICGRLQHHDPKSEQYHKLRSLKSIVERYISFLQLQKQQIVPGMKDRVVPYEKVIVEFINQHIRRKQVSPLPTHMQQQQQSQSQPQVHNNQMNPQISTMNLQNNSRTSSPGVVPNHPQMMNSPQETNPSSLHQQNSNFLVKQEQQQMMQTQEMKHHQFQQRQMHPQFIQKQKLLQQQISDGGSVNNDTKMRQQIGNVKLQLQQQQQIKQGSPFSVSSPQLLQSAGSPQISQYPSPQNVNSPFIVPSPMPGESDKVNSCVSSLSNNNNNNIVQNQQQTSEQPIDRLLKAVKSISKQALSDAVSEIGSVVSATDKIAGSAPGIGSRSAVGEDLVPTERNFTSQDESNRKRMKRYKSSMPLDVSDLEPRKLRLKANHDIVEEIREINQRLIDTVVELNDPTAAGAVAIDCQEGTVVKFSFSGVSCAQMSLIQPLRLLIPTNYPKTSPILLDTFPDEAREHEDLSVQAKSRFSLSLRALSEPITLGEIATTWDICARAVILEYAEQNGGGSFSSKYGKWENCMSAA